MEALDDSVIEIDVDAERVALLLADVAAVVVIDDESELLPLVESVLVALEVKLNVVGVVEPELLAVDEAVELRLVEKDVVTVVDIEREAVLDKLELDEVV